jgi:hypothetical protein
VILSVGTVFYFTYSITANLFSKYRVQFVIVWYNYLGFLFTETLKKIMFLGSKVRLVRGADNLTAIYEPIV